MTMKKYILISISLFLSFQVFAQSAKLNRAAQLMDELNYTEAIKLYNEILSESDDPDAKMQLAKAYRMTNDTKNAEYWYGQIVRLPQSESIHKLRYGQMLQINGKCDQAKSWFEIYATEKPGDHRGQMLLKSCDQKELLESKNAGIFVISNSDMNSAYDDFGARYYENGVIFSSDRDKGVAVNRTHTWTGNPFLELFYAKFKEKKNSEEASFDAQNFCQELNLDKEEKFNKDINSKFHDALVSISPEGDKMMFTRNNLFEGKVGKSEDGIVKLKIYESKKQGEEWSDLTSLPFNSDEYSVTHPAYSADGKKLFFSSDMPGGFGGMDLYVSENENGRWGPPFNLGPLINTEGNELFPFYGSDGKLYFSSDGQIGLGGLDIYCMQDLDNNLWGEVENLGAPINSSHDDFAVSFRNDMKTGFLSSNRPGGRGGDDIYCFTKNASPAEILVIDLLTDEPIKGALVTNECTGLEYTTNDNGKVQINIPNDTCCNFFASKDMYIDNSKNYCTKSNGENTIRIGLEKAFDCHVEGVVFDQSTGRPLRGALVSVMNSCNRPNPLSISTDSTGYYKIDLSSDCCFTIIAEANDYLMNPMDEHCADCKTGDDKKIVDIFMSPTKIAQAPSSTDDQTYTTDPNQLSDPVVDSAVPIVSDPSIDTEETTYQIIKDPVTGKYIYEDTGELANENNTGEISYVDGVRYFNGRPIESETEDFERSPSAGDYSEGSPMPFLLHIYYDFDKSYIRDSELEELGKLCRMLQQNPNLILEISSHTDARGSKSYNRRLSQDRADAVVNWLQDNCGIAMDRLIPRGYGESQPVNSCLNNVGCSEEMHQLNRRTEFRVIGCVGEQRIRYSKPKENPEVDPCTNCSF